jgi:hypothetical protein
MTVPSLLNAVLPFPNPTGDSNITLWHKFIRKGKILFMPNGSFSSSQFVGLYNAGFIFGTNDNGSFPFTPTSTTIAGYTAPANQYKVMPIGPYNFLVRTIKASEKPTNQYIVTATDTPGSEWIDLMGRLGLTQFATSPQDKWNDLTPSTTQTTTFTQQFTGQSAAVVVGNVSYWDVQTGNAISAGNFPQPGWIPIFELIP